MKYLFEHFFFHISLHYWQYIHNTSLIRKKDEILKLFVSMLFHSVCNICSVMMSFLHWIRTREQTVIYCTRST